MKKFSSIVLAGFVFLSTASIGLTASNAINIQLKSPIEARSVSEVMLAFFDILVQIGAVAVTLAIVYAGFMFVAAQGNPEKINQAKKTLLYTVIGALVLLGAQVIAKVIESTITQLS